MMRTDGDRGRRRRGLASSLVAVLAAAGLVCVDVAGTVEAVAPGYNGLIAFTAFAGTHSPGRIDLLSARDGTGYSDLASGSSPAWSPDGTSIVFEASANLEPSELWAVDVDGSNLRRLTSTPSEHELTPAWSPDGSRIAFSDLLDIVVMDVDGSGRVNLTNGAYGATRAPSWSPDGTRIAFVAEDLTITIIDAGGSGGTALSTTKGYAPDWSPDGSKIVFTSAEPVERLVIVDADGTDEEPFGGAPVGARWGSWSPDGRFLVWEAWGGIFRSPLDGSEPPRTLLPIGSVLAWKGDPRAAPMAWQPLLQPPTVGEFTPLSPARILDTRTGIGRDGMSGPLTENVAIDVEIAGNGGVPPIGVAAVVMNVTVTQPTASSYLTVWPSGGVQPGSSNLNFVTGQTIANHVTVAVGDDGRVNVVNRFGTAHVIFDVVGFYADDLGPPGSRYHPVDPSRLFDTRTGLGGVPAEPVSAAGTLAFDVLGKGNVPSSGVTAVVMNVTVARPTEWSYLTVFPGDLATPPFASNLNYLPGRAVPNLVTVRVPENGIVKFSNGFGTAHVIADVVGYFAVDHSSEAGRFVSVEPYRTFDSRGGEPWGPDEVSVVGDFPGFGFPLGEAEAVVLNVTVARPTAWSYLSVYPSHLCSAPDVSNLNFVSDQIVANQVVTRLGTSGGCAAPDEIETIAIYNHDGFTHVVIDVFGFYTAATTTFAD